MADVAPDNVFIDDIIVPAVDGFALAGTLFLPRGRKTHAVLINSAAGVPRKVYQAFAAYLASRGAAVLTYDYRGTGGSQPPVKDGRKQRALAGFDATLADWAARDVTAAVAWMRGRYKDLPLAFVGHGFGGHALGLIPNSTDAARALLIASPLGCWKHAAPPERYRLYALTQLFGGPLTKMFGYMPGRLAGSENLPKGVFRQWARWVGSPRYLFDDKSLLALGNFANYTGPLRALCFTDDPQATQIAVELFAKEFTATRAQIIAIDPKDVGAAGRIGHRGFFRPELHDPLWRGLAEWLESDGLEQRVYPAALRA